MKIRLLLVISFLFLMGFRVEMDSGHVTVQGNVYFWNPERIEGSPGNPIPDPKTRNVDWETWPGGSYIPARQTLTHVEFWGFNNDISTFTNENGWYRVTKSNPWWGSYSVDIEMRASVFLDNDADGNPIVADTYEDHTDIYQYNGQTAKSSVGRNGTLTLDVYIGGPQNNISEWWNDSKYKTITSFYMAQMIQDAHRWVVERAAAADELSRDTYLIYPDGSDSYNFTFSLPGRGVISMAGDKNLFPSDLKENFQRTAALPLENNYRELRGTLTHEFGHKIMADVYWTLPPNWTKESHGIDRCVNPDLAFVEGFAEFFSGAVLNRATLNGSIPGSNIEHAFHPNKDSLGAVPGEGDISWRDDITCRLTNEAENAAVLWDVYDPMGWEYMDTPEQQAKPAYWPGALKWYDSIEDQNLEKTWHILKEHNPDNLMDEGDLWEDSFWYYWLDHYEAVDPNSILIHGVKAILYNRGISSTKRPERAPENLQVIAVDETNQGAMIKVTEKDGEDKNYLRYNIAFTRNSAEGFQLYYPEDRMLNRVGGAWSGDTYTVTLPIPPRAQWNTLVFMVHDNMRAVFTPYGDPIVSNCTNPSLTRVSRYQPPSGEPTRATLAGDKIYLPARTGGVYVLEKSKMQTHTPFATNADEALSYRVNTPADFSAMSAAVDGNTLYVTDGQGELRSYDISNPAAPRLLDDYVQRYDGKMRSSITDTYGLQVLNQTVYMAGGYNGLFLLDARNPAQLKLIENYIPQTKFIAETPYEENVLDVKIAQQGANMMAYFTTLNTGVYGVYVNPNTPYPVAWSGYLKTPGNSYRMDNNTGRVYIADGSKGLRILDNSGEQLVELGALDNLGTVESVAAAGNTVYVASNQGVYAVDVSNPRDPKRTCFFNETGPVMDIVYADNYIYTVSPTAGLMAIRVQTNP